MVLFSNLNKLLSKVSPLLFIFLYLMAVPTFGILYTFATPNGFYAPYAHFEPDAFEDRTKLASMIKRSIQRSLNERKDKDLIIKDWKLDQKSLYVDNIKVTNEEAFSVRIGVAANGVNELRGARQLGWSIVVTIPEHPVSIISLDDAVKVYHYPEADFSKYVSPFKEYDENLFNLLFGQDNSSSRKSAPALVLNYEEEIQLKRYLRGVNGDPSAVSGHFGRMLYLSAVIITTLGLGDIVPITWQARTLVAIEAVTGIVLAGLFLNALASRASSKQK